jgi:spore coat polysaccharide biosynthesis predicted glycosyltransferase SpsG
LAKVVMEAVWTLVAASSSLWEVTVAQVRHQNLILQVEEFKEI